MSRDTTLSLFASVREVGVLHCGPIAHRSDPESSYRAGQEMIDSGKLAEQCKVVLEAVREFSGTSSKCIAAMVNLDRHMVARRLPDLAKKGLVKRIDRHGLDCAWEII